MKNLPPKSINSLQNLIHIQVSRRRHGFAGSAKNAYRLLVGSFDFHLYGGIRCLLFVHLMADTGGWEKHENEGLAVTSLENEDRRCADEGSSKQEDYLKTKCSCLAIS
ncbi:hypothetical protein HanXRQr2_Chr04g0163121 [Helianthus annuus]|uniref:Uncharacterized protein n=1 Tax=Helianthus annuus TaxID=4232 RepID=A0A9K3J6W1_HELAN|nr:hypothetical protein HanXRQr2_Chr04g0163121 [Helianthus annuus]KAJ0931078.1 hypothetical protein HanPSC8_Chr04g0157191 [Helianthus annuus]